MSVYCVFLSSPPIHFHVIHLSSYVYTSGILIFVAIHCARYSRSILFFSSADIFRIQSFAEDFKKENLCISCFECKQWVSSVDMAKIIICWCYLLHLAFLLEYVILFGASGNAYARQNRWMVSTRTPLNYTNPPVLRTPPHTLSHTQYTLALSIDTYTHARMGALPLKRTLRVASTWDMGILMHTE